MIIKLRLALDVDYEIHDEATTSELYGRLFHIAQSAVSDGLLTGDSEAEVETWHAHVSKREEA